MCWSSYDRRDRHRERGYRVADRAPAAAGPAPAPPAPAERDPDLRVSQAERDEVVNVLARHYTDGRLSLGEYEDRVATALSATTGRDLDTLFTDLPGGLPTTATAPAATGPAPTVAGRPAAAVPRGLRLDERRGPGPRLPLVLLIVAVGILVTPWAFFALFPVMACRSHGHRHHAHHHGAGDRDRWDHRWDRDRWDDGWGDDREPARVL